MAGDDQTETEDVTAEEEETTAEEGGIQTTVHEEGPCRRVIEIEADADYLEERYSDKLDEFSSRVELPGFRPGKAPQELVEKKYGSRLKNQVLSGVLSEGYDEAVEEADLDIVGEPAVDTPVEEYDWSVGQPATFRIECEVLPEVELEEDDYKGLEIEVPRMEVTTDMVRDGMKNYAQQFASREEVTESGIDREDDVECEVRVTADEGPAAGWSETYEFTPSEARIGPFAVDGLAGSMTGVETGEEVELTAAYDPAEGEQIDELEEMDDEEIPLEVEVRAIYREQVPEINEEFTEKFDLPSPGEIQEMVRESLEERMESQQENMKNERAREALAEAVDFDLPDSLVEQAAERERRRLVMRMLQQGRPVQEAQAMADRMNQQSREMAETNLKSSYLLREIADQERLYVTESELAERMQAIGNRQGWDSRTTEKYFDEDDRRSNLRDNMREEKALEFVVENANVREVDQSELEERAEQNETPGEDETPELEIPGS